MHSIFAAAFLDLDGTLVDSEPLHCEAHVRFLATRGIVISYDDAKSNIGKSDRNFYQGLMERHNKTGDVQEWLSGKNEMLINLYRAGRLKAMPGAFDFLDHAAFEGVPCVVVTSSHRDVATIALEVTGLAPRLTMRICHDDTALRKPYPDPYLLAARRLSIPAADCLVVEDSISGVTSGAAAGSYTVALRGHFPDADILKAGARRIIDQLTSLIPLTSLVNASDDGLPTGLRNREKTTARFRRFSV